MAVLTVRNVPDEVHRALKARATAHGHSAEAEVRAILREVLVTPTKAKLGDSLVALGRELDLTEQDVDALESARDRTAAMPLELP
jgi:plasmid stability protein